MTYENNDIADLLRVVAETVARSWALKEMHLPNQPARISYCAIFCHTEVEFSKYTRAAATWGRLASDTPTGPVFVGPTVPTVAGELRVIKVRKPDATRPERGDGDFALANYSDVKDRFLSQPGFKLIVRPEFEMIELTDSAFDVRAYFSNPPVEEHRGIREALASDSRPQ